MNEYLVNELIRKQEYTGFQVRKLHKTEALEILSICMPSETIFPEHSSPTDAVLVVLEGTLTFHISGQEYQLEEQESLAFPKERQHWVKAHKNSKFLIIR